MRVTQKQYQTTLNQSIFHGGKQPNEVLNAVISELNNFVQKNKASIYQSNRYPFSRALIGSHNTRYPRQIVDFEAEVKMARSASSKNKKKGLQLP